MKLLRLCISLYLLLYACSSLVAQEIKPVFNRLKSNSGFSQSLITSIAQDNEGFVWFGTEDGLHRYDGYNFVVFTHNPEDTSSISNNVILSLLVTSNGTLWVGTEGGGLNAYDSKRERFQRYSTDKTSNGTSLSNNNVYALCEGKEEVIWIGTSNGLNAYDPKTKTFRSFFKKPNDDKSISSNLINALLMDRAGTLWIGTHGDGIDRYRSGPGEFTHYSADEQEANIIRNFYLDSKDNVWIGTNGGGLGKYDRQDQTFKYFKHNPKQSESLNHNKVRSITEDDFGRLWIGTSGGGLNRFDPQNERFTSYTHDPSDPESLSHNVIRAVLEDNSGVLWIGTYGGGINSINNKAKKFRHYNFYEGKSTWSITEDEQGWYWLGTSSGLVRFNSQTGKSTLFKNNISNSRSISNNTIRAVFEDDSGIIWAGTSNGLNKYNPKTNDFSVYQIGDGLCDLQIRQITQDKQGTLWIATNNGLARSDGSTGQFECIKISETNPKANRCRALYIDERMQIWVGTYGAGLYKYSPEMNSFKNYSSDQNGYSTISNDNVWDIYADANNVLWIATDYGLNKYDLKTEKFKNYTKAHGLPHNAIRSIIADDNQKLWVSTAFGITKFNPETEQFRNYFKDDGLQGNDFNSGSKFKTSDGQILLGGINGFNSFDPDLIKDNNYQPPVRITKFSVLNKEIMPGGKDQILNNAITFTDHLNLSYKQNFFSFEFSAMNFMNPHQNEYSFIMEGFDEDWNFIGTRRRASYTNLPPGKYIFKVKAANNDKVWNHDYTSLSITVVPPFWQTNWFRAAMIILAISTFGFIYNLEIRRLKRKEAYKTEVNTKMAESKLTALRSQMNPHFIFNSLNSIQYFITENDQESAMIYLSNFSKLIRKTLENSHHRTISLEDELTMLRAYIELEELRFENRFDFEINVAKGLNLSSMRIPPLILQPFVENAIIHGLLYKEEGKGRLLIDIAQKKNKNLLQCIIEDNGVGRQTSAIIEHEKSKRHTSMGTKIMDERLAVLNQKDTAFTIIDLTEEKDGRTGTRVIIDVPVTHGKSVVEDKI